MSSCQASTDRNAYITSLEVADNIWSYISAKVLSLNNRLACCCVWIYHLCSLVAYGMLIVPVKMTCLTVLAFVSMCLAHIFYFSGREFYLLFHDCHTY